MASSFEMEFVCTHCDQPLPARRSGAKVRCEEFHDCFYEEPGVVADVVAGELLTADDVAVRFAP